MITALSIIGICIIYMWVLFDKRDEYTDSDEDPEDGY